MTAAADHAYRVVLEERIRELVAWRRWYRANRWADWADLRERHEVELRALVKLARHARRISRGADHDGSHELAPAAVHPFDPYGPTEQLAVYQAEGR